MNERIKELELQCWEPTQYGPAWFNSTKFAELIVKECIDVCANGWQGEFTAAGISQCVSDLREHFGVESE
jgi:hypothetical protein